MLYFLLFLLLMFVLFGAGMSIVSHNGNAAGIENGRLTPCPVSTNCVCSEYPDKPYYVNALVIQGRADEAWSKAVLAVKQSGGEIVRQSDDYLAARYTSRFFRFIDDLELRLDPVAGMIHVRSSSRVGRSDFGANARRIENLRKYYQASLLEQ